MNSSIANLFIINHIFKDNDNTVAVLQKEPYQIGILEICNVEICNVESFKAFTIVSIISFFYRNVWETYNMFTQNCKILGFLGFFFGILGFFNFF